MAEVGRLARKISGQYLGWVSFVVFAAFLFFSFSQFSPYGWLRLSGVRYNDFKLIPILSAPHPKDGVFVLRLIEHNHGSIMATLIVSRLWEVSCGATVR